MFQNIRADIVYYNTNTDFEMEFNLCGCCRMRLLTDKVSEKRNFLNSLARAVSRSKVIMITGNLFGDEGVIKMSASAIGNGTEIADNKKYGIVSDEKIEIIKGSVPLVTPEGYFGGCIIENGPQVMIVVSDNKNIRKSIMKNLIHPYIEELYAAELKDKASATATTVVQDEITEEAEEAVDLETEPQQTEELQDETDTEETEVQSTDDTEDAEEKNETEIDDNNSEEDIQNNKAQEETESDDEINLFGGMIFETDEEIYEAEEDSDLFVQPLSIKKGDAKHINTAYYDFENEEETGIEYSEFEDKKRVNSLSFNIPILIISVLVLLLIALLSLCVFYIPTRYGSTAQECIYEIYTTLFNK